MEQIDRLRRGCMEAIRGKRTQPPEVNEEIAAIIQERAPSEDDLRNQSQKEKTS
jgi:hypothetical protein